MCNCGSRRQALNNSSASLRTSDTEAQSVGSTPGNGPVRFRYTGNNYLNVKSTAVNHVYNFSIKNRLLIVRAEDVPVMRRLSDLVAE